MNEPTLLLPQDGDRIGAGIVISLINGGGSARVYKTWIDDLEIHRAVKVMNPDATPEVRERFSTEAKIAAKLIHPNIVQAYNYGLTAGGLPYIEMELVSGHTLESVIGNRGALPLPVVLAVGVGILEAVHYAHSLNYTLYDQPQRGVIHRDIKPGNVIFSGGVPKLMDFGIARPVAVSIHTQGGNIPGTIPYMPPEVCTGGDSDFRSDIYQIGLLLYECVSGQMAYPQTDMASVIEAVKTGERKALQTHAKLNAIIKKCLALDPDNRYQTAQECLADIRALYHVQSPATLPDEHISAYLQRTPTRVIKAIRRNNLFRFLKVAAVAVPSIVLALALVVFGFAYGNRIIQSVIVAATTAAEPNTEQATPDAAPPSAVVEPPPPPAVAVVTPRPTPTAQPPKQAANIQAPAQATPPPSGDDAAALIAQGERNLKNGDAQAAFANFQKALKSSSATMEREQIIQLSLYGSARASSTLYDEQQIAHGKYLSSWRSVRNTYPAGSPEHAEASRRLKAGDE